MRNITRSESKNRKQLTEAVKQKVIVQLHSKIDLHVGYSDLEGQHHSVGWNQCFRDSGVVFSGDITHSNAAEYIDIDLRAPIDKVYANIHLFSGKRGFKDVDTSKVFAEKPNGKRYATRREIFNDPSLLEFFCPWCGKHVKCEPWLALKGGAPITYGVCPDGDEFLVQLSASFHQRGEYSVKRMIFEMSDDLWDIYMDKKEALVGVSS